MMIVGEDLYNILRNVFHGEPISYPSRCIVASFLSNDIFSKFFVLDISQEPFEVPMFVKGAFEDIVEWAYHQIESSSTSEKLPTYLARKLVVPMYQNILPETVKSPSTMCKEFFSKVPFHRRILKVKMNSETYYGGNGIILDKDFEPLLLCTLMCQINNDHTPNVIYTDAILHINPKIFMTKGRVQTFIINKIIPFYCLYNICSPYTPTHHFGECVPVKTKISIDNKMNQYIVVPDEPIVNKNFDNNINQFLINNKEKVLEQI